ncbi:hypothetical protein [Lacipirellula limnantheis]|uniref:Uncharacterized protein n=1 Tax=Lacipirellula limnantheis TaxID=2528024 RepID=A0A517TTM2_9BACT|nr:hypothetical protein [Lacipirellula limnantheis]QDT71719.1 hypothetical protein I41_08790 [Lacipirellula limnantheis]
MVVAYGKLLRKEALSRPERAALVRFEKVKEERLRWQYYRSIPKKHWRKMSGRQAKTILEQASRYGLPLDGPTIDLPKVVRALHDFLAANAYKLSRGDDPLLTTAQTSPALERYREERALLAQLDRMERQQELVPLEEIRFCLDGMAHHICKACETLERKYGNEVAEVVRDAIRNFEAAAEEMFGEVRPLSDDDESTTADEELPHSQL